jgi:hypothetical protein
MCYDALWDAVAIDLDEGSAGMRYVFKTVLAASLAPLAFGAVASTSALAAPTNPMWEVEKVLLGEGKSEAAQFSQAGTQVLSWNQVGSPPMVVRCSKLKAETPAAKILGSIAPNPGTSEETLVFEGCEVEGHSECLINKESAGTAKIKTQLLKSTLAFETASAAEFEKAPMLTYFQPKLGAVFMMIEFSGSCKSIGSFSLEGQVAANVKAEELGASHELKIPSPPIANYFVNEAGKVVEKKIKQFSMVGLVFRWVGNMNLSLTSGKSWRVLG